MFHGVSVKLCVWNCSSAHQYYKLSLPSCPLFKVTAKNRHMSQTVTSRRYNIFCETHWHKDRCAIFFTDWALIFVDTTRSCSKWVDTLCLPYGGSVVQVPISTIISGCVTYAWFSNSSDIQLQRQSARCCIHQNQLSTETHLSVCALPSPLFLWPW